MFYSANQGVERQFEDRLIDWTRFAVPIIVLLLIGIAYLLFNKFNRQPEVVYVPIAADISLGEGTFNQGSNNGDNDLQNTSAGTDNILPTGGMGGGSTPAPGGFSVSTQADETASSVIGGRGSDPIPQDPVQTVVCTPQQRVVKDPLFPNDPNKTIVIVEDVCVTVN